MDRNSDEVKRSSKGIPHRIELEIDQYRAVLQQSAVEKHKIKMNCLRLTRDKQMARFSIEKRGLSDIFFKMRVLDDGITCAPLVHKGEFL